MDDSALDGRALAGMVAGAAFLSTSAPWVRLSDVGPATAGFYRMLVGCLALVAICLVRGQTLWRGPAYALRLLAPAACFATDLFLWHRCIPIVGPGMATILANLQVFLMAAAGVAIYGERPGWRFVAGLALALPGVVILVGADIDALQWDYALGLAFGLGAAAAYTGYLIALRGVQGREDALSPAATLAYATGWCGTILALLAVLEGSSFAIPTIETGGALLAYGLFCQVGGWMLITGSMPRLPAAIVGLLLLLQPGLAMVWDVLFFDRPPRWLDLGGAILVLAGLYSGTLDRELED